MNSISSLINSPPDHNDDTGDDDYDKQMLIHQL